MREVRTSGSVGASGGNSRGHPTRRRYPLPSPVWVPDARTSWGSVLCGPASPWSLGGAVACPRRRRRRRPGQAPRSTVFLPSRRHRFPSVVPPVQRAIHETAHGLADATRAPLCIAGLNRRRYPLHRACMALYHSKRHGFPALVVRRRRGLSAPEHRAVGIQPFGKALDDRALRRVAFVASRCLATSSVRDVVTTKR